MKLLSIFICITFDIQDVYKNIEEYNPGKRKILIESDDVIADIISNKILNPTVT